MLRPEPYLVVDRQLALEGKLKTTLDSLVQHGVLSVVDEPTDFVSQMAIVEKADHSLRICIDPQVLNRAGSQTRAFQIANP